MQLLFKLLSGVVVNEKGYFIYIKLKHLFFYVACNLLPVGLINMGLLRLNLNQ